MTKLLNHLSKQALDKKEVLGARKAAESTRCAEGRYEVAIPWKDNEPPLQCIRTTTKDRLYSLGNNFSEGQSLLKNTTR